MSSNFQLILLAIVVFLIIYYEVPNLWQEKQWKELIVFSVVLIIGTGLLGLWLMGVDIPAPFEALGFY